jgi:hypothetical protein
MTWGAGRDFQPDAGVPYWTTVTNTLQLIAKHGLKVHLTLEDGCSLDQPSQAERHWFVKKVGSLEKFFEPDTWSENLKRERITYMSNWFNLLGSHNIPFLVEILNEPAYEPKPKDFIAWHTNELWHLGIDRMQIVVTTAEWWLQQSLWTYGGILSVHGITSASQIKSDPQPGWKIIWSGDGLDPVPSKDNLQAIGVKIKNMPEVIGYEMKANMAVGAGPYMELDKMDFSLVEAISKTLNSPEIEPLPLPDPLPEPDPESEKVKEMNKLEQIWHWLFGDNSFYQKYPFWTGVIVGLFIVFILLIL